MKNTTVRFLFCLLIGITSISCNGKADSSLRDRYTVLKNKIVSYMNYTNCRFDGLMILTDIKEVSISYLINNTSIELSSNDKELLTRIAVFDYPGYKVSFIPEYTQFAVLLRKVNGKLENNDFKFLTSIDLADSQNITHSSSTNAITESEVLFEFHTNMKLDDATSNKAIKDLETSIIKNSDFQMEKRLYVNGV